MTDEVFEDLVMNIFRERFGYSLKTVVTVATCDDLQGVTQDVRLLRQKPAGSVVPPLRELSEDEHF